MSVIQNIRDKYARWAVIAIALALLGFILTDYLSTRNRMFGGGNSTTIGSVNGKKIEYAEFESKLKSIDAQSEAQAQQQGRPFGENEKHQNVESLWSQEVDQLIMNDEIKKLGIEIGKRELNDWLFGSNPPQDLKQRFSNEQGQYNPAAAQDAMNQMKRSPNQADRNQLEMYLDAIEYNRQVDKFNSLLSNSIYYPKWYLEKQNTEASGLAKISYVLYPYSKIADSTVKISNEEINEYVNKHKEQYKQNESRSIEYVIFSASPTSGDSAAIKTAVGNLKAEFETTPDPSVFVARYGSAIQFYDGYVGQSLIQVPEKDSIFALAKNAVYGPYQDNNSYVMAKMLDFKPLPDSVKARHILIQTADPQKGQVLMDDSIAKKRIDSISTAIKGGASFDELAKQYSTDQSSAVNGGLLANPQNPATNYFTNGQMVKEFNDFCFDGKTGDRDVVKTVFGYHLIEILDQKNFEPHYKVAYFAKNIVASDETDRTALSAASKFASESRTLKAFDESFDKTLKPEGYQKLLAANIKPMDNNIEGLSTYGFSRSLVRDIYKAEKGDVLKQQRIGDKYVVAAVTDVINEGIMGPTQASISVEPILRNKKKAEQIKKMLGNITTLDAASKVFDDPIKTADSIRITGGSIGYEPKLLGAVFNPANKGKIIPDPINGVNGVYVVQVNEVTTTSLATANIAEEQKQQRDRSKQMTMFINPPQQILKKTATIKDNRTTFY